MNHVLNIQGLIICVVSLAVVQLLIQLFFFLHLGHESKPRLNLITLLVAVLVIGMVVGGSVWIMHNLNYNMSMSQQEINKYMRDNEGL
jgi:cytochrome o ubiquinol oxidase operon protein cyoD